MPIVILLLFLINFSTTGQSCLPQGITFSSQADIDNFQNFYPGCTEIEGTVMVHGEDVTDLTPLSVLIAIGGSFGIQFNPQLTDLSGLENLTYIGGDLLMSFNTLLVSMEALSGLTSLGGGLTVVNHPNLGSLAGLENLTSMGGGIFLENNPALAGLSPFSGITALDGNIVICSLPMLTTLEGLGNISHIGGSLVIENNGNLSDITALGNLISIDGDIWIVSNPALTGLSGLENVDAASVKDIWIAYNYSLSSCDILSLCDYLSAPGGTVDIHENTPGCSDIADIAGDCGFVMDCLPHGNYHLNDQSAIDGFQDDFPGCTELKGSLVISGDQITNLSGLHAVTSVSGDLILTVNSQLSGFGALSNMTTIGGDLAIVGNNLITDLSGLSGLTFLGSDLQIYNNVALNSLQGLGMLEPGSIDNLGIYYNSSLSECETEAICNYLQDPNGEVDIFDNASGCNSQGEVEQACEAQSVAVKDIATNGLVYPNPAGKRLCINRELIPDCREVRIYNRLGCHVGGSERCCDVLDISFLEPGMYVVELLTNSRSFRTKICVR